MSGDGSGDGTVRWALEGAVARITLDRPAARNAMTWAMYEALARALDAVAARAEPRVLVLRGAGGHFAAGTDIGQFAAFASPDDGVAYERRLERAIGQLEHFPLPTVAVVEGVAAGGGLALAAACDLRLCTPEARFGAPIAQTVGNTLSVANLARLVAHLGVARTSALVLAAQWLDAGEARASGFVLDVVPRDGLDARVDALCERVATLAPITLRAAKEGIRRVVASAQSADDTDLLRRVYGSRDFAEGVAAFVEKRPPRWEGR